MIIKTDRDGLARIGEFVKHRQKLRRIIGYAVGEDGQDCYVASTFCDENGWRTHLVPACEVESKFIEVPVGTDASILTLRGECGGCTWEGSGDWHCSCCVRKDEPARDYYEAKEEGNED